MDSSAFDDLGENESGDDLVSFFPSLSRTYSMWYKRRYMLVRRERDTEGGGIYRRPKELLKIRYAEIASLTTDATVLTDAWNHTAC